MNMKEKACTVNAGSKVQIQDIGPDYTNNPAVNVSISIFTSDNGKLSKTVYLSEKGELKKVGGGVLSSGQYKKHTVSGLKEFDDLLNTLTTEQAVAYGVADIDTAPVKTTANKSADSIARNGDTFSWPEDAGVMMIDYDPEDSATTLSPDDLHAAI